MLRDLHRATRSFRPPPDAEWFPWHGRDLGDAVKVIGHVTRSWFRPMRADNWRRRRRC
jgi:hypothetical protein